MHMYLKSANLVNIQVGIFVVVRDLDKMHAGEVGLNVFPVIILLQQRVKGLGTGTDGVLLESLSGQKF